VHSGGEGVTSYTGSVKMIGKVNEKHTQRQDTDRLLASDGTMRAASRSREREGGRARKKKQLIARLKTSSPNSWRHEGGEHPPPHGVVEGTKRATHWCMYGPCIGPRLITGLRAAARTSEEEGPQDGREARRD